MAEKLVPGGFLGPGGLVQPGSGANVDVAFYSEDDGRQTLLNPDTPEEILYEWPIDFADFAAANLQGALQAIVNVGPGASIGTFRVYTGSVTPRSLVGAVLRATLVTNSLLETPGLIALALFANPGGQALVQITGQNDTPAAAVSYIRGVRLWIG